MALKPEELEEIKAIIKEGQEGTVKAVREMFVSVGINIANPIQVQSEMAFLSKMNKLADSIVSKIILIGLGLFGAIAVGWAALKKG